MNDWFSARVRFLVSSERGGWLHYADILLLVSADGFDAAFIKAIECGRQREEKYKNDANDVVAWTLKEVLTLDRVGAQLDGAELYYESRDLESNIVGGSTAFRPESSSPSQTL